MSRNALAHLKGKKISPRADSSLLQSNAQTPKSFLWKGVISRGEKRILRRQPDEGPMPDHNYFSSLIWQIADLLRGPYRPPQYERVMLPMTVLRRFDCVVAPTKEKVLKEYEIRKGGKLNDEALDKLLNL
jgi:hypothetical protein